MKTTQDKTLETGTAGIIIELSKGSITVRHQDSPKTVLLKRRVKAGFWSNQLWAVLRGSSALSALCESGKDGAK